MPQIQSFPKISDCTKSKYAWLILKNAFHGGDKVVVVKRQSIRRDFETLFMKGNESVQDFFSRVSTIFNQLETYGEVMTD